MTSLLGASGQRMGRECGAVKGVGGSRDGISEAPGGIIHQ